MTKWTWTAVAAALALAPFAVAAQSPAPPPAGAGVAEGYYQFLRGRWFEGEGRIEDAIEAYRAAARADPRAAEVMAELAGLLLRHDRIDEAIAAADAALGLEPANAEAHWVLGTAYSARALRGDLSQPAQVTPDTDRAIEHLEQALPERRLDIGLHLRLGRLYLAKGKASDAVAMLSALLERSPGSPRRSSSWPRRSTSPAAGRRPSRG